MHFSLVKINPPDVPPSHGFDDVILPLYHALKRLGYDTEILVNSTNPRSRNIVFGSCIAPRRVGRTLPKNSIIFNLEQFGTDASKWTNRDYLAHLQDFTVWDYSPRNIATLTAMGITRAQHVPLGYVEEMTRINPAFPQDTDVLFYGSINDRRHTVIKGLCAAGIKVLATQEAFGELRDSLIARSKLLLHVHYYTPAIFETARLGYVFANKKAVAAEWREDTEIPAHLASSCAFFPYGELVEGVQKLLADEAARKQQELAGFEAFTSMPLVSTLEALVGRRNYPAACATGSVTGESLRHRPYHTAPVSEWLVSVPQPE